VTEPETTDAVPTESRPTIGIRLGGIALDWALCLVISSAIFPSPAFADSTGLVKLFLAGQPLATLGIWAVQHFVLVALLGMTYGHRFFKMRVVRNDGTRYPGMLAALKRTVLLALVIPAVVWDNEGRGLHDRVAGTHLIRLEDPAPQPKAEETPEDSE
jgi:uncharacterized RDD family membrane protein YckC